MFSNVNLKDIKFQVEILVLSLYFICIFYLYILGFPLKISGKLSCRYSEVSNLLNYFYIIRSIWIEINFNESQLYYSCSVLYFSDQRIFCLLHCLSFFLALSSMYLFLFSSNVIGFLSLILNGHQLNIFK